MNSSGPQKITTKDGKTIELVVDRQLCTGCGSCVALAPKTFALDNESKSIILDKVEDRHQTILESAKACPVMAILVKDENGKQIYP